MPRPNRPGNSATVEFRPRVAYRAVLLALGLIAGGLLFKQLSQLALLVAIAVMLALPLAAGATRLQRLHVPRALGALISLLAGGAIVGLILYFAIPPFVSQVNSFIQKLPTTVTHYEHGLTHVFGLKPGAVTNAVTRFADNYTKHPANLLGPLSSIGLGVATGIGALVVVLISAIYMAVSPRPLVEGALRLFSPEERPHALHTMERIRRAWLGWLRGLLVDMLVFGGLLFLGLRLDGLPFAGGFAILAGLLTVIPGYGPVISALPPILYGLTFSVPRAAVVAVIYIIAIQLATRLVPPAVRGQPVRLHPAVIAIGTLINAALFGVLGLIVSVPLISLVLILIDELWVGPFGSGRSERSFTRRLVSDPSE